MKVSTIRQKHPLLTESYEVLYKQVIRGVEVSLSQRYYSTSKNAHKKIHRIFKKNNPDAFLIRIIYE